MRAAKSLVKARRDVNELPEGSVGAALSSDNSSVEVDMRVGHLQPE
jgi:hypothetical protein